MNFEGVCGDMWHKYSVHDMEPLEFTYIACGNENGVAIL
jgi:hypothetical protein